MRVLVFASLILGAGLLLWFGLSASSGRVTPTRALTDSSAPDSRPANSAHDDAVDVSPDPTAIDQVFSPGWIGAACRDDGDCPYEGGFCLMPEEGFTRGTCSHRCRRLCPDRRGPQFAQTFCVEDPQYGAQGLCLARCNLHLTASGCRPGYVCSTVVRLGEQQTTRLVCLPDQGSPPPPNVCTDTLRQKGMSFGRPDLADALTRARRGGPAPAVDHCQVDTPVLLASPVHGVDFRERGQRLPEHLLVACALALVIEQLAALLAHNDVVEVEHAGTFVCRTVDGSRSLSGHGHGLAIDITAFERAQAEPVSILEDWSSPDKDRRRWLRELVRTIRASGLFDVVLTPASNKAHADHLHLEIFSG